ERSTDDREEQQHGTRDEHGASSDARLSLRRPTTRQRHEHRHEARPVDHDEEREERPRTEVEADQFRRDHVHVLDPCCAGVVEACRAHSSPIASSAARAPGSDWTCISAGARAEQVWGSRSKVASGTRRCAVRHGDDTTGAGRVALLTDSRPEAAVTTLESATAQLLSRRSILRAGALTGTGLVAPALAACAPAAKVPRWTYPPAASPPPAAPA